MFLNGGSYFSMEIYVFVIQQLAAGVAFYLVVRTISHVIEMSKGKDNYSTTQRSVIYWKTWTGISLLAASVSWYVMDTLSWNAPLFMRLILGESIIFTLYGIVTLVIIACAKKIYNSKLKNINS